LETKVFVTSSLMAMFLCPECGKGERKDVSSFIKHETKVRLKYKCPSCTHPFSVTLERRRSLRKEVNLKGNTKKVQLNGNLLKRSAKYPIIVQDISKHGLKIKLLKKVALEQDSNIDIEFTLDDIRKSLVLREVQIKKVISPEYIGCEFTSDNHHGNLGKYFAFNA
jgi:transcriptional regulator NrdR family protein